MWRNKFILCICACYSVVVNFPLECVWGGAHNCGCDNAFILKKGSINRKSISNDVSDKNLPS